MTPQPSAASASPATAAKPREGEVPAALRPSGGPALLRAMAKRDEIFSQLVAELPGAMAKALLLALAQAPADKEELCSKCAMARAKWDRVNGDQLRFAWEKACSEKGLSLDDPASAALNLTDYIPGHLRHDPADPFNEDRMPLGYPRVTTIAGWALCVFHVQAEERSTAMAASLAAQEAAEDAAVVTAPAPVPAPQLLVPPRGMDVKTAAAAASVNVPGVPGYARP